MYEFVIRHHKEGKMEENNDKLIKHNPIDASSRDMSSPVWDMSQERAFIENLLNQRFNFFLIFFSITMAGFVNTDNWLVGQTILTLGSVILILIARAIEKSEQKLDLIVGDLCKDISHPIRIINDATGGNFESRRRLIGIIIPRICYITMLVLAILHLIYILAIPQGTAEIIKEYLKY